MSEKAERLEIIGGESPVSALPVVFGRLEEIDDASGRNTQRGLYSSVGVRAYAQRVGTLAEPIDQTVSDLLGDLRHLCDALGMDFMELTDRGQRHYDDEIGGEG